MTRDEVYCRHRKDFMRMHERGRPVFTCDVHGECSVNVELNGVAPCSGCPNAEQRRPPRQVHRIVLASQQATAERGCEWISSEQLMRDVRDLLLPKLSSVELSGIAGVPRSGMIAASYLATLMHLPLYEVTREAAVLRQIGNGRRPQLLGWGRDLGSGRVLVLEDSTYSGTSLAGARARTGDCLTAAVYHRPLAKMSPDYYARELEAPHMFEWHFFNSGFMNGEMLHPGCQRGSVLDMDGIICRDPTMPDSDTAAYEEWLSKALPLWVPRLNPCRAILTARLERYRLQTEAWLARHNAKYSELIMRDVATYQERGDTDVWKTSHLKRLAPSFYVESSERRARRIRELWSGGTIVCPPHNLVLPTSGQADQNRLE